MERKYSLAFDLIGNAVEGILITDENANIHFTNKAFTAITGYSSEESFGKNPNMLKSGKHDDEFYKKLWKSLKEDGLWKGEIWNKRKDGEVYPQRLTITTIKDHSDGGRVHYASIFYDLSEVKKDEAELKYKANYDVITGLPNRNLFKDRLEQSINRAKRGKEKFAVLFVDLDDFKNINDSFGHNVGDLLLKEISMRLINCARDVDTVSHIGGDEFTVILDTVNTEEDIRIVASRILESISKPFYFEGNELHSTVSIGIAMYPSNGRSVGELIRNADMAMYHVKDDGKNNYHYFTESLNDKASKRMELEIGLRKAIKNKEIIAFYQPKVDIKTGEIIGMEALARWPKLDGTFAEPSEFTAVAEQTGLIMEMDMLILEKSCIFLKKLKKRFKGRMDSFRVAVNLSAKDLETKGLICTILKTVRKFELSPSDIDLEVTESLIIKDVESTIEILNYLNMHGFSISIDDFGTGYSSLSYLTRFPLSSLKIDKTFVDNIVSEQNARSIARAIVSMSHGIGVKAIAEGVESREQLDFLRNIGCDQIQGHFFSRPVPEKDLIELMESGRTLYAVN
jgi:diguanylate cyclase (GGDEF)-like protein/PAS domain S-box-containing protein